MGATAVGTGLNAEPNYIHDVAYELSEVVGEPFYTGKLDRRYKQYRRILQISPVV